MRLDNIDAVLTMQAFHGDSTTKIWVILPFVVEHHGNIQADGIEMVLCFG